MAMAGDMATWGPQSSFDMSVPSPGLLLVVAELANEIAQELRVARPLLEDRNMAGEMEIWGPQSSTKEGSLTFVWRGCWPSMPSF